MKLLIVSHIRHLIHIPCHISTQRWQSWVWEEWVIWEMRDFPGRDISSPATPWDLWWVFYGKRLRLESLKNKADQNNIWNLVLRAWTYQCAKWYNQSVMKVKEMDLKRKSGCFLGMLHNETKCHLKLQSFLSTQNSSLYFL